MAFITQNSIDGQWETWIDGVTIRGTNYDAVEAKVKQLIDCRNFAQVEEALDALDEQAVGWGGPEIAVASLGAVALLGVLAAGYQIVTWLMCG